MEPLKRLTNIFYTRDVLEVAPDLLGKYLVRKYDDDTIRKYLITEVEAYRGEEDLACHASKGRTPRTEIMYHKGGYIYVYLIYGIYWMLNIVTAEENNPQAILIRGIHGLDGPGKITKNLLIDKSFYGEHLATSKRLWIETPLNHIEINYKKLQRIGIDYAGKKWKSKPWRYLIG
ncbi:MAG: DNA-3-methyladenine glycosylase [Thiohalospira sp.]